MSSTGRQSRQPDLFGGGHRRHADDFYRTPAWTVEVLLEHVGRIHGLVLEPGCDDGAILDALQAAGRSPSPQALRGALSNS